MFHRKNPRREQIRKERPDVAVPLFERMMREENYGAIVVAIAFVIITSSILMMRPRVLAYRPGQWVPHDIVARVDFTYRDVQTLNNARQDARVREPRLYRTLPDPFALVSDLLSALPDQLQNQRVDELAAPLNGILDSATLAQIQSYADRSARAAWKDSVITYVTSLRNMHLLLLPEKDRQVDLTRMIRLQDVGPVRTSETYSPEMRAELENKFSKPAKDNFSDTLFPKIIQITLANLKPTHELDVVQTATAQNRASADIPDSAGDIECKANMIIVARGELDSSDYAKLHAEHEAYLSQFGERIWMQRLGLFTIVCLVTIVISIYISTYQPRIVRNHARAAGLVALMVSMLLLAQLTGVSNTHIYVFGIAPTIITAMILAIAYDQRFAIGLGGVHAVLATLALGQDLGFLMILITGVATSCFMLDDVRSRSRLIEVGGAAALAMMGATFASGWLAMDPFAYILRNAIYAGAAGLGVGFVLLGILPFIERVFRITTSISLLELADASHPLLRRLSLEAPGTYNHSLQVATLAEEAAEVIDANSLLCRVAAYYHDVGKINKSEYFIENQASGENRHLNLNPSVSLLIIIGHVKDGIELAKEYNLPTSIFPFIQQHHGTTLVEFFYHRARNDVDPNDPTEQEVEEHQYRYPGPKPRSKEVSIVMLADACESACRAMEDHNSSRIETLVHDIAMKRLMDGQFDESDLTMRELELIERALVKTLLGIYHGRISYPSDKTVIPNDAPAIKTA